MIQKNDFAWFLLHTGWTAIISNGWWILITQKQMLNPISFIPVFLVTLLLSVAYVIILAGKFINALDEK